MNDVLIIPVQLERLDAAAAPEFKRQVEGMLAGHDRVLLDLGAVAFIDSTGLGVLVAMIKQMGPGGKVAVIGASVSVARLFRITQLDTLFQLCVDEGQANAILAI